MTKMKLFTVFEEEVIDKERMAERICENTVMLS